MSKSKFSRTRIDDLAPVKVELSVEEVGFVSGAAAKLPRGPRSCIPTHKNTGRGSWDVDSENDIDPTLGGGPVRA